MKNVFVWMSGVAVVLAVFRCSSAVMPTAIPSEMAAVDSIPDPVEFAAKLLEKMAEERQASLADRDRLSADKGNVEQKPQEIFAELGRFDRDLKVLQCQIAQRSYPFCLNGAQICNRAEAVRRISTLSGESQTAETQDVPQAVVQ